MSIHDCSNKCTGSYRSDIALFLRWKTLYPIEIVTERKETPSVYITYYSETSHDVNDHVNDRAFQHTGRGQSAIPLHHDWTASSSGDFAASLPPCILRFAPLSQHVSVHFHLIFLRELHRNSSAGSLFQYIMNSCFETTSVTRAHHAGSDPACPAAKSCRHSPHPVISREEGISTFPPASLPHEFTGGSIDPEVHLCLANHYEDDFYFSASVQPEDQLAQHSSVQNDISFPGSPSYATGSVSLPMMDAPSDPSSTLLNDLVGTNFDKASVKGFAGGLPYYENTKGEDNGQWASCIALGCEDDSDLAINLRSQKCLTPHSDSHHSNWNFSSVPRPLPAMGSMTDNITEVAAGPHTNSPSAYISTRFSRESIQVLKRWLILHSHHPYLSEEETAMLQRQTGLNKTQISNWLANARRKGKAQSQKPTFSYPGKSSTEPIDIPRRPGTPAFQINTHSTNPLQRWVDSPPEDEPASVAAITRAIASSWESTSGQSRPSSLATTDEESNYSIGNVPSPSSAGSSSASSMASAYSHVSDGSLNVISSMKQLRGSRRRRKRAAPKREETTSLITPLKQYQCTFCTEAFRTKHDWQRHEKSLHLSLERWICAPYGPRVIDSNKDQVCCVFCGKAEPDETHMESHHHTACKVRPLGEKTFYRKDHLEQHLKLVHNVKFLDGFMKTWKFAITEVRSRCGFCGIVMNSWPARVEHLAEHFKRGTTMADWKGDWGFEEPVLDMLENSIPPCM